MKVEQTSFLGKSITIDDDDFNTKYKRVLASSRWKNLKKELIKAYGNECWECGISGYSKRLELHHINYKNLGRETEEDVELLCPDCHLVADTERENITYDKNRCERFERIFRKAWETRRENIVEERGGDYMGDDWWWNKRQEFRHYLFCKYFDVNLWGSVPRVVTAEFLRKIDV